MIYTLSEIIEDIATFEKGRYELDRNAIPEHLVFLGLYSDQFDSPLQNGQTMGDFHKRITEYLIENLCPPLDREIDEAYDFSVYGGSDFSKGTFSLIKRYVDEKDFRAGVVDDVLNNDEIAMKYPCLMVITGDFKVMQRLVMDKH